jgi:hypothetical protein
MLLNASRKPYCNVFLPFLYTVQVTHSGHSLQVIPNLTLKDSEGHSALGLALILNDRLDIAELLLTGGANVNDSDSDGKTLLFQAIERHDVESAIFLLKHQADPDAWYVLKTVVLDCAFTPQFD